MALKYRYGSKEELPGQHAGLYAERDGAWVLDFEGVADKTKLDEFRNNNTALLKQIEEQRKRFEGIDPDEFRKLANEKRQLEEAQQLKAGEVEKVVENRVKGPQFRVAATPSHRTPKSLRPTRFRAPKVKHCWL